MSALMGDKGWCNWRSKGTGDQDAGEEGRQHLGNSNLWQMKDDTSHPACLKHLEEDLPGLIYVSVRLQTL